MSPSLRTLVADRGDAGVRLDRVLRRHLADVQAATRTRVQAWIAGGCVTVNGRPVQRVAARAALGDLVSVAIPDALPRRAMRGEDLPLDVLYEDDACIAINKPAGMVVHPAFKHPTGTLMNALLGRAREWGSGRRPSIVGRLDKLTSGIVIAAKTRDAHALLQQALHAGGERSKIYLALVYGRVNLARGAIDLRLALDRRDRRRVVASADTGAHSVTTFERLARVAAPRTGLALLQCALVTGRRHQIRAHLQARGWPIVGDPAYGEPRWRDVEDPMLSAALRAFPRQALHASHVSFVHPISGRLVEIDAPLPADFASLLEAAGFRRAEQRPTDGN
ncbi:MAG TPA: RluA family pseudouridine synthase [Vicinamibacterales bacterium]|nr:RluA family pseudouridine synthase [Vicinamibacterales bacterium]